MCRAGCTARCTSSSTPCGADRGWRGRPPSRCRRRASSTAWGSSTFRPPGPVAMALLALTSLPRARFYRGFQSVHAGLGLAAVAAALLHDLPILIFAAPGLVDWFAGRYDDLPAGGRRLPARARVIPGTSGPWVEMKIELAGPAAAAALSLSSPAGAWVGLSVEEISAEVHPISVAALTSTSMTLVVSGNGGDWCDRLASFASKRPRPWVLVKGPYPSGGWRGSRSRDPPAIMLIAGGTGITGWLPSATAGARVVWTVQQEGDYRALADRLPRSSTDSSRGRATRLRASE